MSHEITQLENATDDLLTYLDDTSQKKASEVVGALRDEHIALQNARVELRKLNIEIDCRIEHGANSGGHLEYVRTKLNELLAEIGEAPIPKPTPLDEEE